jgi:6-phosphogluconolactonase
MRNLTRKIALLSALLTGLAFPSAPSAENKPSNTKYLAYVGTYTTKTNSKGIYSFHFDAATGQLSAIEVAAETPDPSWVAVHHSGKYLYAANEAGKASTVSAFAVDAKSGKLTPLNHIPSLGEDPCYLSLDKTGKYVLVANYSSGTIAVFPILADGRLGEHTALLKDQGATGPNKEHQKGPHAHWIETSMGNGMVFVADLGLDRVMTYKFDSVKGTLGAMPAAGPHQPFVQNALELSPGTGPRHVAISKVTDFRQFLYVLGELNSTITVFGTTKEGIFGGAIQKVPMLPAEFSERNDAAEIEIHPSGKFLYASNRGHDSIAIFAIGPVKGTLSFVARVPTGGKEPRHFAIDPSGKYLLAENQFSNNIVVFKIDPATGGLTPTGQVVEVPSPVDIAFFPME